MPCNWPSLLLAIAASSSIECTPALAVYTRDEVSGLWHGSGLLVITVRGDQVAGLTRFESHTLRAFGLPRLLPGDEPDRQ